MAALQQLRRGQEKTLIAAGGAAAATPPFSPICSPQPKCRLPGGRAAFRQPSQHPEGSAGAACRWVLAMDGLWLGWMPTGKWLTSCPTASRR